MEWKNKARSPCCFLCYPARCRSGKAGGGRPERKRSRTNRDTVRARARRCAPLPTHARGNRPPHPSLPRDLRARMFAVQQLPRRRPPGNGDRYCELQAKESQASHASRSKRSQHSDFLHVFTSHARSFLPSSPRGVEQEMEKTCCRTHVRIFGVDNNDPEITMNLNRQEGLQVYQLLKATWERNRQGQGGNTIGRTVQVANAGR